MIKVTQFTYIFVCIIISCQTSYINYSPLSLSSNSSKSCVAKNRKLECDKISATISTQTYIYVPQNSIDNNTIITHLQTSTYIMCKLQVYITRSLAH